MLSVTIKDSQVKCHTWWLSPHKERLLHTLFYSVLLEIQNEVDIFWWQNSINVYMLKEQIFGGRCFVANRIFATIISNNLMMHMPQGHSKRTVKRLINDFMEWNTLTWKMFPNGIRWCFCDRILRQCNNLDSLFNRSLKNTSFISFQKEKNKWHGEFHFQAQKRDNMKICEIVSNT